MLIALVMIIALTCAMYGIELFKESLLDVEELHKLSPDTDFEFLGFVDILINTISLAFLADNSTIEAYKKITALLSHSNIHQFPDLKSRIEQLEIFS